MTAPLAQLRDALAALSWRISGIRWALEHGERNCARVLEQLHEAERELDEFGALVRAAEQAAPPEQPRLRRRRAAQ